MDTAQLLQAALQMEREGEARYRALAGDASNEVLRAVLLSLADAETKHVSSIEMLYSTLKDEEEWPEPFDGVAEHESAQAAVEGLLEDTVGWLTQDATAVEAYQAARDFERRAYEFYRSGAESAGSPAVRKWFRMLASVELLHVASFDRLLRPCDAPTRV